MHTQNRRGGPSSDFLFQPEHPPRLTLDIKSPSMEGYQKPGCCQKPFVYYAYYLAILLGQMCGVLFLFLSCYLYILRSDYVPLLHNQNYMFCVSLMVGAGLLILVNGCLSCSAMNSRCVLCIYTSMLFVILGMQVALSYTSFVYSQVSDSDANHNLPRDLLLYRNDTAITRAIDVLQIEGRCCGAIGFEDYKQEKDEESEEYDWYKAQSGRKKDKKQYIPDSCCRSVSNGCGKSDHPSNIHYHGCLRFLQRQVKQHIYMIFTLSLAGTILQIFAIFVTCCICVRKMSKSRQKKKKKQETRNVNGKEYNRADTDMIYLE